MCVQHPRLINLHETSIIRQIFSICLCYVNLGLFKTSEYASIYSQCLHAQKVKLSNSTIGRMSSTFIHKSGNNMHQTPWIRAEDNSFLKSSYWLWCSYEEQFLIDLLCLVWPPAWTPQFLMSKTVHLLDAVLKQNWKSFFYWQWIKSLTICSRLKWYKMHVLNYAPSYMVLRK